MSHIETKLRAQPRLDSKWLKTDLQLLFTTKDNLDHLWNGLISDGELTGSFSDGLLNSAGVLSKKGEMGRYYCGLKVSTTYYQQRVCYQILINFRKIVNKS